MKTRIIHTKFWKDDFVASLTPEEKLVFNFYITNEEVNILHLYEVSEREVMFYTGVCEETLKKAKDKLEKAGKVFFKNSYVFLKNADRYEDYNTTQYLKAKENLLRQISPEVVEWYRRLLGDYSESSQRVDISNKTKVISNKKEIGVVKREEIIEEVVKEIAEHYQVPESFVYGCKEEMENWFAAKGKTYKDKKAGLRNWVLRAKKDVLLKQKGGKNDRYGYTKVS